MVICLERGADLHMAQMMPLPLTVSCFSKIQIGFTFLVPAHPGSPGQMAVKWVCVCVCVCVCVSGTCCILAVTPRLSGRRRRQHTQVTSVDLALIMLPASTAFIPTSQFISSLSRSRVFCTKKLVYFHGL